MSAHDTLNAATAEANGRYRSRLIEDYDGDRFEEDEYGYDATARQAFVAGALWARNFVLTEAGEAIRETAPNLNAELNPVTGQPEPGMAAYIEGFHDAFAAVDALIVKEDE